MVSIQQIEKEWKEQDTEQRILHKVWIKYEDGIVPAFHTPNVHQQRDGGKGTQKILAEIIWGIYPNISAVIAYDVVQPETDEEAEDLSYILYIFPDKNDLDKRNIIPIHDSEVAQMLLTQGEVDAAGIISEIPTN